ncbi:GA module-containing protein [Enterococcus termitis]
MKAAKEADATKVLLAEQKAAKDKIDALEYLSVGAKATAKANVDLATDSAGITKVLNEAIYDNYQAGVINAEVELDEAKTIAKEAVGKLENLTTTQKNAALNDITKATDKAAVTNVLNAAKDLDQQNADAKEDAKTLEKAKEDAKAVIDALKYLTQEVKNGYKAEITNAKDIPAVAAIETRAKNEDADIKATEVALESRKKF